MPAHHGRKQQFDDLASLKHWVAVGRVPGSFYDALEGMAGDMAERGMAHWHPHFGKFADQSLDMCMFLREGVYKRPVIDASGQGAVLESILNADEITLIHAISGDNTLERVNQLYEFANMILGLKMRRFGVGSEEARHHKPHFSVMLTKGYGDRNDQDFSKTRADNNNPNNVTIFTFASLLRASGVNRLFFTEPHSFDAMRTMINAMGAENVCFPTLSGQFTDDIMTSEALRRDYADMMDAKAFTVGAPDGGGKWRDTGEEQASLIRGFNQLMDLFDRPHDHDVLKNWQDDQFMRQHFILFDKVRDSKGKIETQLVHGDVRDKMVILVDDVSASGGTIIEAAEIAYKKGAAAVVVCLAHPGFVRYKNKKDGFTNALDRMMAMTRPGSDLPLITHMFVGGTVPSFYHRLPQWVGNGRRERVTIVDVHDVTLKALVNLNASLKGHALPYILPQIMPHGFRKTFTAGSDPSTRREGPAPRVASNHPG